MYDGFMLRTAPSNDRLQEAQGAPWDASQLPQSS